MKLYFAPLEGITTNIYRSVHLRLFGGCDGYFSPFLTTSENERITQKTLKDILPEKNEGQNLCVQVLSNNAEILLPFLRSLKDVGYDEVNINLGCPSGTVVGKNRGSGLLRFPDLIDSFLYSLFACGGIKISVKTRIGFSSPEEFPRLLEIYNKYPLSLLTVHPRTRSMLYGGEPDMTAFDYAYANSKNPLCYNGNICSAEDYEKIKTKYPNLHGVMIGRGAVKNPALFREIRGGAALTKDDLMKYAQVLTEEYFALFKNDTFTLHKLKEIWLYVMQNYPDETKITKSVKKANRLSDFSEAVKSIPEI